MQKNLLALRVLVSLLIFSALAHSVSTLNAAGTNYGASFGNKGGTNQVTTLADDGPGSLRQAIADAQPEGTVSFSTNGVVLLTSGELLITNNLFICGPGATNLIVSGNHQSRVFRITNAAVSISGITISHGQAPGGVELTQDFVLTNYTALTNASGYSKAAENGGGILNYGDLRLSDCSILTNAAGAGGAENVRIDLTHFTLVITYGAGGCGGGIYSSGSLKLTNCTFAGNAAGCGGGGFSSFPGAGVESGHAANGGAGGAVQSLGTLSVRGCLFMANQAGDGGRGVFSSQDITFSGGGGGDGGAIYACGGIVAIESSSFCSNSGGDGGAGMSAAAEGTAAWGGNGGNGGNGGAFYTTNMIALTDCSFFLNRTGNGGGGGDGVPSTGGMGGTPLSVGGRGGSSGSGGALFCKGATQITRCTVDHNSTGDGGDGGPGVLATNTLSANGAGGDGGDAGPGGGIYSGFGATLKNTTLSSNKTGAGGAGGAGGALLTAGLSFRAAGGSGGSGAGIFSLGELSVVSSTICSNMAGMGGRGSDARTNSSPDPFIPLNGGDGGNGGNGGGICRSNAMGASLHCVLLAGNSAGLGGPGGAAGSGISPGATGTNGIGPDLKGLVTTVGYNLISVGDGSFGVTDALNHDQVGTLLTPVHVALGPLADNGGPTLTHAVFGSAVDAGDNSLIVSLPTDQRGRPRLMGAHVDIGAFELDPGEFSAPTVGEVTVSLTTNHPTALADYSFFSGVNPQGLPATVWVEYAMDPSIRNSSGAIHLGCAQEPVQTAVGLPNLVPSATYFYRLAATNFVGASYSPIGRFTVPSLLGPGDLDGDGKVDKAELDSVMTAYRAANSPPGFVAPSGLGSPAISFQVPDEPGALAVEYTTNLTDWYLLGPATLRYEITDTNAPSCPQRFYRLRWP